jgi:hypothetical protein
VQCNSWLEGYMNGVLYALLPNVPTWYIYPIAIKATFFSEGDGRLQQWDPQHPEQRETALIEKASSLCGCAVEHEKTAACVLMAAHHFVKYSGIKFSLSSPSVCPDPIMNMEVAAEAKVQVEVKAAANVNVPEPKVKEAQVPDKVKEQAKSWSKAPSSVKSGVGEAHVFQPIQGPKSKPKQHKKKPLATFQVEEP